MEENQGRGAPPDQATENDSPAGNEASTPVPSGHPPPPGVGGREAGVEMLGLPFQS